MTDATTMREAEPLKRSEPFLGRVRIRNYKSIGKCDVTLAPVTILVGRNGSGKSNFLDALRFIYDALQSSLDHAIKARGGIDAVRRRSTGHPRNFAIAVDMNLPDWRCASYAFEIAARQGGGFVVKQEELRISRGPNQPAAYYLVQDGKLADASAESMPPTPLDRLYLLNAAGLPAFRPVYDALTSMGFYNLNPDAIKNLQSPDAGELLHRDGANIASVIARLAKDKPEIVERIRSYLERIVPGILEVERVAFGPSETLQFRQRITGSEHPWKFFATSMSDGTLRALGILVAATQLADRSNPVSFVGIEEPETALHPAAARALMDALREAAQHTQILVTSHSSDLLDQVDLTTEKLLVVAAEDGDTRIAEPDNASLTAIRNHLYLPGELLRLDQLQPNREDVARQEQMQLFASDGQDEE